MALILFHPVRYEHGGSATTSSEIRSEHARVCSPQLWAESLPVSARPRVMRTTSTLQLGMNMLGSNPADHILRLPYAPPTYFGMNMLDSNPADRHAITAALRGVGTGAVSASAGED